MSEEPTERQVYLAFIDVLGVRALMGDWERATQYYRRFAGPARMEQVLHSEANKAISAASLHGAEEMPFQSMRLMSDSFIVAASDIFTALDAPSNIQTVLLDEGIFVRGCIAFGRHLEWDSPGNFMVVSEALVRAYEGESTKAVVPRVLLDESASRQLADDLCDPRNLPMHRFAHAALLQGEDDQWFLDPLYNIVDAERLVANLNRQLQRTYPARIAEKYRWLAEVVNLSLYGHMMNPWDLFAYRSDARVLRHHVRRARAIGLPAAWPPPTDRPPRFFRFPRLSSGTIRWLQDSPLEHPLRRTFGENTDFHWRDPGPWPEESVAKG